MAKNEQIEALKPFAARAIIEDLREGSVPVDSVPLFTVGRQNWLKLIEEDLDQYIAEGGAKVRFVNGDYGDGKTHFMSVVRHLAREKGFAVSFVVLTREIPVHKFEVVYQEIVRQLDAKLPEVICQRAGILQVINSLLSNAVDAMLEGGVLTVRSSYQRGTRRVSIEIEDSGGGLSKEDRKRIFDPFFTTKPVGEGTGLGLSLARSIVQAHGGQLKVVSPPGSGAVFRLTLPQDGAMTGSAETQNSGRYDE